MNRDVNTAINLARRKAGQTFIENPISNPSSEGVDSKMVYEHEFLSLLSVAPWNFATRRSRLKRLNERPTDSYTYFYQIPVDGLYLWDIYNKNISAVDQVSYFLGSHYSYYIFPLSNGLKFLNNDAEIVGGKIASNFSELSCLYTVDRKYSLNEVNQQFYDTLLMNMEEAFFKMRNTNEEAFQLRVRSNNALRKERKGQTSRENRKAYNKRPSELVEKIRSYL